MAVARKPQEVQSCYITPEGVERLREELRYLWKVERPRVTKAVTAAAAEGDRSENAEYIYGKKRLREIDSRVRFLKSPEGLRELNYDLIFATYWTSDDQFEYWHRKSIKCAEVLVPHRVPVELIIGAYVLNATAEAQLREVGFDRPITCNPNLFFA